MKKKADRKGGRPKPGPSGNGAQSSGGAGSQGLLDLDSAVALLRTTRPTFYRWLRAGKFKGMKAGRQWRFYKDDLERFLRGQDPKIDLPADISPLLGLLDGAISSASGKTPDDGDLDPPRRAVERIVRLGILLRASDIHMAPDLKPEGGGSRAALRYRIDGALHEKAAFDSRLLPALVEQFKSLSGCNRSERSKSQDGRALFDLGGRKIDLRTNFLPSVLGEALTVRILDPADSITHFDIGRMGLPENDLGRLRAKLESPWGMVVITGPTGSGKTTTLYACLQHASGPGGKTITIEDPVEFLFPGMVQIQVNPASGMDFAAASRAALRADPDVVMVGEIRDRETCRLTQQMALTGHIVLTAMHAGSAAGALTRLAEVGGDSIMPGEAVKFVLAQRLVRLLCNECSTEAHPPAGMLEKAEEAARRGGVPVERIGNSFRAPGGCPRCGQTGYWKRGMAAEGLEVTRETAQALSRGAGEEEIEAIAVGQGMTTLAANAVLLASKGLTSLEEVFRVLGMR